MQFRPITSLHVRPKKQIIIKFAYQDGNSPDALGWRGHGMTQKVSVVRSLTLCCIVAFRVTLNPYT